MKALMIYTSKEQIEARMLQIQNYLNRKWVNISDNFVERLIAVAEYDKLKNKLNENNVIQNIK